MSGAMRPALQGLEILTVIPFKPPVESLWTNPKVPAGQPCVTPMSYVEIKPFQPFIGFRGNISYPFPYDNAAGNQCTSYLHDTIISVTYLSEPEQ